MCLHPHVDGLQLVWYTETLMSDHDGTGPYTRLCVLVYLGTLLCGPAQKVYITEDTRTEGVRT